MGVREGLMLLFVTIVLTFLILMKEVACVGIAGKDGCAGLMLGRGVCSDGAVPCGHKSVLSEGNAGVTADREICGIVLSITMVASGRRCVSSAVGMLGGYFKVDRGAMQRVMRRGPGDECIVLGGKVSCRATRGCGRVGGSARGCPGMGKV